MLRNKRNKNKWLKPCFSSVDMLYQYIRNYTHQKGVQKQKSELITGEDSEKGLKNEKYKAKPIFQQLSSPKEGPKKRKSQPIIGEGSE